ncbi:zinc-ribbon domain-containing protein [Paracoccus sp. TK19116]|uniref:Zinc-ribbon domain-containing protein n=1 Tax=Paracoccus albicereus TaxID=2922394 RepID=A0ABT1MSV6_9RHOB|nr:zinc-ribbon domain-containing protein [Paracoccus albicereus]MCQ0971261.1 zinc-ribbon domain-containing protein [Paracoccus albicereus]
MEETRLICPGCGAEYRLDATLIPAAGRQVECSSCGRVWFQPGEAEPLPPLLVTDGRPREVPHDQPLHVEDDPDEALSVDADAPRLNRPLPRDVLSILVDEARRERVARQADARRKVAERSASLREAGSRTLPGGAAIGEPPVLPPSQPADPAGHIHRAPQPAPRHAAPADLEATVTRTTPSRPVHATAAVATAVPSVRVDHRAEAGARGFGWGIGLCLAALILYHAAPHLDGIEPLVEARAQVDHGRIWLYEHAAALVDGVLAALR